MSLQVSRNLTADLGGFVIRIFSRLKWAVLGFLLSVGVAGSAAGATVLREGDFQLSPKDVTFAQLTQTLDLSNPSYQLIYKSSGTSLGLKIEKAQDKVGKWMPWNEAAEPESQRVSYTLAQFLHMSELVAPTSYYTLQDGALGQFQQMVRSANETEQWRKVNQEQILAAFEQNPQSMFGVFVGHVGSTLEVEELINAEANTVAFDHPLATMIRVDGPQPSPLVQVTFKNVVGKDGKSLKNDQLTLARELSKIMVLDCLIGQWDRWSGGNLEVKGDKAGVMHFIARDNGGGTLRGTSVSEKYFEIVSRFDRQQVDRVRRLAEVLDADSAEVARALDMKSSPQSLLKRVHMLLDHIEQQENQFGDAAYFP